MNMRSALEVDPNGFQCATEAGTGRLACRRVFLDGTTGIWVYVDDGRPVSGPMSVVGPRYLAETYFRAIMEDRADDALKIVQGMTADERLSLDRMLARANRVVNLYRQASDSK